MKEKVKEKNKKKSIKKTIAKILIFASVIGITATGLSISKGENNIVENIKDKISDMIDQKISEKYPPLQAPQNVKFDIDNNLISWDKVENATFYEVNIQSASGESIYLKVDDNIDKDAYNLNGADYATTNKCSVNIYDFRSTLYKLGYKDGDVLKIFVHAYNEAARDVGKIQIFDSNVRKHHYRSPEGAINYVIENQNDYFYNRISNEFDETIRMILGSYLLQNYDNEIYNKDMNFLEEDYNRIKDLKYTCEIVDGRLRLIGTAELYNEYFIDKKVGENTWRTEGTKGLYRPAFFDIKIEDYDIVSCFKEIKNNKDYFKNGEMSDKINEILSKRWILKDYVRDLSPVQFYDCVFKYTDGLTFRFNKNSTPIPNFDGRYFVEDVSTFIQETTPDCMTNLLNFVYPGMKVDRLVNLEYSNFRETYSKKYFDAYAIFETKDGKYVETYYTFINPKKDKSFEEFCESINDILKYVPDRIFDYISKTKEFNYIKDDLNNFLQEIQNYKEQKNNKEQNSDTINNINQNETINFEQSI